MDSKRQIVRSFDPVERSYDQSSRVHWEDSANTWEYKAALRVVLVAFAELLTTPQRKIGRQEIAKAAGITPAYLSSILSDIRLTRDKFDDIEAGLLTLIKQATVKAMVDPTRIAAAKGIIESGLDARVRVFETVMVAPSKAPRVLDSSELFDQREKLTAMIQMHPSMADFQVPNDERVLGIIRSLLPHVTRKELGFSYHLLGDAVSELGSRDREIVGFLTALYKRAAEQHVHALMESLIQLVRSRMRTSKDQQPSESTLRLIEDEVLEIVQIAEVLRSRFHVNSHGLADLHKSVAEYVCSKNKGNAALQRREYERALLFYVQAISEFENGPPVGETPYDLVLPSGI